MTVIVLCASVGDGDGVVRVLNGVTWPGSSTWRRWRKAITFLPTASPSLGTRRAEGRWFNGVPGPVMPHRGNHKTLIAYSTRVKLQPLRRVATAHPFPPRKNAVAKWLLTSNGHSLQLHSLDILT